MNPPGFARGVPARGLVGGAVRLAAGGRQATAEHSREAGERIRDLLKISLNERRRAGPGVRTWRQRQRIGEDVAALGGRGGREGERREQLIAAVLALLACHEKQLESIPPRRPRPCQPVRPPPPPRPPCQPVGLFHASLHGVDLVHAAPLVFWAGITTVAGPGTW